MTEPTPDPTAGPPADERLDPPPSAAQQLADRPPPESESERQTRETVRSVSRLEESD